MSDLADQIRGLRETTESNRRQFLRTELQTCFIALERAQFELSLGNTCEAEKEYVIVCRAVQVVDLLLSESPVRMPEIVHRLALLKVALESLWADLDKYPG